MTGGTYHDSEEALKIAEKLPGGFSTVGVHPTRCNEIEVSGFPDIYFNMLTDLARNERVKAIGECGLDYDRLQFCDKETQKKYFERQLRNVEYHFDYFFENFLSIKGRSFSSRIF